MSESEAAFDAAAVRADYSSELGVIGPRLWLASCRATARLWRRAAARGVAVHPMHRVRRVPMLRDELAAALGLDDRRPQLVLRIGYGEPEDESLSL